MERLATGAVTPHEPVIEYHDRDPVTGQPFGADWSGWYALYYDASGNFYDAVGPYETKEALRLFLYERDTIEYGALRYHRSMLRARHVTIYLMANEYGSYHYRHMRNA